MPVTMLTGATTDQDVNQSQRKPDMDNEIGQIDDDESVLAGLLMRINTRPAISSKVEWLEDEPHPRYTTAAGSYLIGAASFVVAAGTGAYFKAGDVIRNELTGENMLVTSVATDTLSVTRGIGSVAAAASSGAADGIVRVAMAATQGATIPTLIQTKKVAQFNYTQIIRTAAGFTGTAAASEWFGQEDPIAYEIGKKTVEHRREIENMIFLGRRLLVTGPPVRGFCGGLTDFVTTNVTTIGGNLTTINMENWLRLAGRYRESGSKRVLFAAPIFLSALASFPLGKMAPPDTNLSSWGIGAIKTYTAGSGLKCDIVEKRDWDDFSKTSPALGGTAIMCEMSGLRLRPLRRTKLLRARQGTNEDAEYFEYLTEVSLEIKHERKFGIIRGVTGF
jgi:hypothetical protein